MYNPSYNPLTDWQSMSDPSMTRYNDESSGGGGATGASTGRSVSPPGGVGPPAPAGYGGQPLNANSADGSSRTTSPAPPRTAAGNGANATQQGAIDSTVYDPSNPVRALRAALSANHISLENPLGAYLMRFAPGLSSMFMLQGASGNGSMGDISNSGPSGMNGMFHNFLNKMITGGGGLAGQYDSLLHNSGVQAGVQNFTNWRGADPGNRAANPWMDALQNGVTQPGGASGMLGSLYTPMLGSFGRPYQSGLASQEDIMSADPSLYQGDGNNILQYLLRLMNQR